MNLMGRMDGPPGISVPSYWNALITGVVTDATPTQLVLTFDKALDEGFIASILSFYCNMRDITNIAISGNTVTLTSDVAFDPLEVVTIAYYPPTTNYLRSTTNKTVPAFVVSVTNNVVANYLVIKYPNEAVTLADASNAYYFSNGAGTDHAFSIATRIKFKTLGVSHPILNRGNTSLSNFIFRVDTTNKLSLAIYYNNSQSNYVYTSGNQSVLVDTDYNLVVTYSGSKAGSGVKLYINGTECTYANVLQAGTRTNPTDVSPVKIGLNEQPATDELGSFWIHDLVVVNKALTGTEVTECNNSGGLFNYLASSFWADVISYHKFTGSINDLKGTHHGS